MADAVHVVEGPRRLRAFDGHELQVQRVAFHVQQGGTFGCAGLQPDQLPSDCNSSSARPWH